MISAYITILGIAIIAIAWFQSVKKLVENKCNMLALEMTIAMRDMQVSSTMINDKINDFVDTYYKRRNRLTKKEEVTQ